MKRSESIAALAAALAKAQGMMKPALKESANPFFKSHYSDLASIINAIRDPFSMNGLSYSQFPRSTENGVEVETLIMHSSGEWMSETLALPVAKDDAQGVGSAISYGKRYGLQAMSGLPSDDDDGNAASKKGVNGAAKVSAFVQTWTAKLADKPNLDELNSWIPETADYPEQDKKAVWRLIYNYADKHNWEMPKGSKAFVEKVHA